MKSVIETPRLILRRLTANDAQAIYDNWASDPEVTRYLTWNPHESVEVTAKILDCWLQEYQNEDCYRYGIQLKEGSNLIGMIDVVGYHHGFPVVGYCSSRRYWNNGYMSEAFAAFTEMLVQQGFANIVIEADVRNTASNRVILKNGYHLVQTYQSVDKRSGENIRINSYRYTDIYYQKNREENMENLNKVCEFLKQCGTYYLATVENDQPRVRPFGTVNIFDGHLYIQTGKVKEVAKQIAANPKVEICGFTGGKWVRVAGQLAEDDRYEAKKSMLDAYPSLRRMYDENDGNTLVLYFTSGVATFSSFTEPAETVEF